MRGGEGIEPHFKFGFVGAFIRFPRSLKGFPGGEAPWGKKSLGGRCRRGERPLTRGGSRKKIGYNEEHTEQRNC